MIRDDSLPVRITSNPGEMFLDRMIALVEGASRQKMPNEVALDILIAGLTMILLVAVVTLQPMAIYSNAIQSTAVLVALFVCLAPTTIGGLRLAQLYPWLTCSHYLGQMGFGGERDPNALAGRQAPAPKGDQPRYRACRHDHPSRRAHIQ